MVDQDVLAALILQRDSLIEELEECQKYRCADKDRNNEQVARIHKLEAALRAIEAGDTMAGRSDWTLADVIQEHYKIARNALAAEQI